MSRTIITHGCTQMMVLSMLLFGGETLHYFALALTIGILFGIYSSVLVMAPLVMWLGVSREDLVKPERKRTGRRGREDPALTGRKCGSGATCPACRGRQSAIRHRHLCLPLPLSHADHALLLAARA